MARDYTDGHGWARLDATSARCLAECMCSMTGRTAGKRREMLLWCFSRLNGGNQPTFRVGARTLAKACGVSHKAARLFIEAMDEDGWFVTVKEAADGMTPSRTFWWLAERGTVPQKGHTLCPKTRSQGHTPCAPTSAPRGTHQNTEYSERVEYSVFAPPPPLPAIAGAWPGASGTEREPVPPVPRVGSDAS